MRGKYKVFDATFSGSKNLVDDKFIQSEALKNYYDETNFDKKVIGLLLIPLFLIFFSWVMTFETENQGIIETALTAGQVKAISQNLIYFFIAMEIIIFFSSFFFRRKFERSMLYFYTVLMIEFVFFAAFTAGTRN